jgi:hypothetical protein
MTYFRKRPRQIAAAHSAVIGLLATVLLGATVSAASANRLSVNELRWRHIWPALTFSAGTNSIRCKLTVEGSFDSAVSRKVSGALSGFATSASLSACTNGSATILNETLPWHYTYAGFTGTLPRIGTVINQLIGAAVGVQPSGSLRCLMRMTTENPGRSISSLEASGGATSITAEEGAEIPLTGEGGLCRFGGEGHFGGTGTLSTPSGGTLTVRLI